VELRPGKILIQEIQIAERVGALADEINREYAGAPLTLVGVLDGCLIFLADLVRRLEMPIEIVLVRVKTYGDATRPQKEPVISADDIVQLKGRHVLIVDDIYDSGKTLAALSLAVETLGAKSVSRCVLLQKERPHEKLIELDHVGFTVPDVFVVGYGLDYAGKFRNLPYIAALEGYDTDFVTA
jgi:hypoxanthine phosphoribosyltransferase